MGCVQTHFQPCLTKLCAAVFNEALDPENRSTSSAYPKQLRDTASHVHAKFLLSQLGLKPPRISSATITKTRDS